MDEGLGALIAIVIIGAVVIWVVKAIVIALVTAIILLFVGLTHVLGHAFLALVILATLGAYGGLLRHRAKAGVQTATSDHDFALVGHLRMLPAGWATLVVFSFIGVIAIYGILFL